MSVIKKNMQIRLSEFMCVSSSFQQLKGVLFYIDISKNHYNSLQVRVCTGCQQKKMKMPHHTIDREPFYLTIEQK